MGIKDIKIDFNNYVDIFPYIILSLDELGRVSFINQFGVETLGFKKEDILNKNWFDNFISPEEKGEMSGIFENLKSGSNEKFKIVENYILNSKKEKILIRWKNVDLKDENGKFIGTLSFGYDISDQKRYEEAFKANEERFKKVAEALPYPLIIMNDQGVTSYWNKAAENLIGYTPEEALGENFYELLTPSDKYDIENSLNLKSFFESGKSPILNKVVELEIKNKENDIIPVELSASPLVLPENIYAIGTLKDLRERKKIENLLKEKIQELERFNRLMIDREVKMIELKEELKKYKLE